MIEIYLLIFLPILTSIIIYSIKNKGITKLYFISQIIITVLALKIYANILINSNNSFVVGGYQKLAGIELRMDRLAISFILLSIIIWWSIIIYNYDKLKFDYSYGFFIYFLQGVFIGFLLANDFFTIFIFIELITILSTILIVYKRDRFSFKASFYYLLFNSTGMLFYLIGIAIIYQAIGTLNLTIAKQILPNLYLNPMIQLSYIFIIVALGVKSAFFPVYNWLPRAHGAALSSVSALLSGLLIKSGIYLFIKIGLIFQPLILKDFIMYIGLLTSLSGTIFAIAQKDIKQLLAFSTISQIGIIIMSLSRFSSYGLIGGVYHIFSHALSKSILFLSLGIIINNINKRRISDIKGVFNSFPILSIIMIISIFSLLGLPLFSGYISKDIIKYSLKDYGISHILFSLINIGTIVYFLKFSQIFIGSGIKYNIKFSNYLSLFILVIPLIYLGFSVNFIENIFMVRLNRFYMYNDLLFFLEYGIYVILGFFFYKKFVCMDNKILYKIRHFNLSFENSVFLLIIFVFTLIAYNYIIVI